VAGLDRHDHDMKPSDYQIEQSAEQRAGRHAVIFVFAWAFTAWAVNSTSLMMEAAREGQADITGRAWFLEGVSMGVALALFFAVKCWEQRFTIGFSLWKHVIPAHILGLVMFSVTHVFLMGHIREALFPILFQTSYIFFDNPFQVFIYELRKDAMTYIGMLLILTSFRTIEWHKLDATAARNEARKHHRVTLKCGGRTLYLEADAFIYAKAAGNYVEALFGGKQHLARMTLSELEKLLIEARVEAKRVHRSWLVNAQQITQTEPTGEGDVTITLNNGETIPGSRRYRDRLDAA